MDFFQAKETLLDRKAQILLEANSHVGTPQEDKDALEGELLSLTGMRYRQRLQQGTDAVAGLFQSKPSNSSSKSWPRGIRRSLSLRPPLAVTPGNLGVDAKREATGQVNIDGDPSNSTALFQLVGRNSSAQEHAVWEEIVHADSISTIKSLQFANETDLNSDGTPNHGDVLDLTVPGQTSLLVPRVPPGAKSSMESVLGAGKVVKTPICHFVYNQWHGVGWLEEDPLRGRGRISSPVISPVVKRLKRTSTAGH